MATYYAGLINCKYTDIDTFITLLENGEEQPWSHTNRGIHPYIGDIIFVYTTNYKGIIAKLVVSDNPITNLEYKSSISDIDSRTARQKGNLSIKVQLLDTIKRHEPWKKRSELLGCRQSSFKVIPTEFYTSLN
jgi:hypothetical protein